MLYKSCIIRPRRSHSAAAYKLSRQTFPWTMCRTYVRRSVGLSSCGKTADRIRMPFGIIGRTGPGMRQVVGFGGRSTGRVLLGANLGRAIVTYGDFSAQAYVCYSAATRSSSQITLGRLVIIIIAIIIFIWGLFLHTWLSISHIIIIRWINVCTLSHSGRPSSRLVTPH